MTGCRPSVVVMARAPRPGATKTRLEPLLGPHRCAQLQRALIGHTVATATAAVGDDAVVVAVDPAAHVDAVGELVHGIAPRAAVIAQAGVDLGARMAAASAHAHGLNRGPLIVIGTDLPSLTAGLITEAIAVLERGCDLVVGPALDGGYYLIGLARPQPGIFDLPPELWGGGDVLETTVRIAARLRLGLGQLALHRDLDTPEDAAALAADGLLPPPIAAILTRAVELAPELTR